MRQQGLRKVAAAGVPAVTAILLSVALVLLAGGTLVWSPWLGAVAALLLLAGAVWWRGGWEWWKVCGPSGLLLLTVIPLPSALEQRIYGPLRDGLVSGGSHWLYQFGVVHFRGPGTIELPHASLSVDAACQGLYTLPAAVALCVFFVACLRRSWLHSLVMVLSVPFWVWLGALGWFVAGTRRVYSSGTEAFEGWRNVLAVGLLLGMDGVILLSLDQCLVFIENLWRRMLRSQTSTAPARVADIDSSSVSEPVPGTVRVPTSRVAWAAGGVFALLGLAQVMCGWQHHQSAAQAASVPAPKLALAGFDLPRQMGAWQRVEGDLPQSRKLMTTVPDARCWRFGLSNLVAWVAVEYPLRGFQDATTLYRPQGWDVLKERGQRRGEAGGPAWFQAEMQKDLYQTGALWFAVVDEQGHELGLPVPAARWERFSWQVPVLPASLRVQVLVTSAVALSPAESEAVLGLFLEIRRELAGIFN